MPRFREAKRGVQPLRIPLLAGVSLRSSAGEPSPMSTGAHFRKCDFQVHTPRDLNRHGNERVSGFEALSKREGHRSAD